MMNQDQPPDHYGSLYHAMMRGNNRQKIFFSAEHKIKFSNIIQEALNKFSCRLHAYCFMSNHIHLIVEVAEIPLCKFMQNISFRYARWFNKKNSKIGHLFQGRYKSILIQDEQYLLELCRYIHRNPVKAKIAPSPESYLWSSHKTYLGQKDLINVTTSKVLSALHRIVNNPNISYQKFINSTEKINFKPSLRFNKTGQLIIDDPLLKEIHRNTSTKPTLDMIITATCTVFNIKQQFMLESRTYEAAKARACIGLLGLKYNCITLTKLAKKFGRCCSTLSEAVAKLRSAENAQALIHQIEIELKKSLKAT
jgi:putative transposase